MATQEQSDGVVHSSRRSRRQPPLEQHPILPKLLLDRLTALGGIAGIIGLIPFLPVGMRVVLIGIFALCAPGGLVLSALAALPRLVASVALPATGVAVLSLILSAELALSEFHPIATTAVISIAAVVRAVLSSGRDIVAPLSAPTLRGLSPEPRTRVSVSLIVAAVAVFGWSIHSVAAASYTSYGLLVAQPLVLVAALLALAAFVAALRCSSLGAMWGAALTLVIVVRGYTLFSTPQALYYYTYRHLGVMDWFAHSGALARGVDVYSDWPGALATGTWFSESSGVSTFAMAHGFTLIYHFALLAAMFVLARTAGLASPVAMTAAVILEALNWVGQDYLSPQAFAFLLALVVLSLMLVARDDRHTKSAGILAALIFTAVTWSHQLTPVWLLVVAVAAGVFKTTRPRWIAAPMILSFTVMVVVNWSSLLANNPGISADVAENSAGNVTQIGAAGQQLTSQLTRGVALALWITVLAIVVIQLVRRRPSTAPIIMFGSSAVVLLSNYGGEAVFRVYLYSLPGAAILLAPALKTALTHRTPSARMGLFPLASSVAALLVFIGAMQCTFGGWFTGLVSTREVAVERHLERAAGEKGQIAAVSLGFPQQLTWRYVPQDRAATVLQDPLYGITNSYQGTSGADPTYVDALAYAVKTRTPDLPVYVVVKSPLLTTQLDQLGLLKQGALERIATHFRNTDWQPVYSAADFLVFANPAGVKSWETSE